MRRFYTKTEYSQVYLKSAHWKRYRQRKYAKYPFCQLCHCATDLNIHHLTYDRLGHERDADTIVLCRFCHIQRIHQRHVLSTEQLFLVTEGKLIPNFLQSEAIIWKTDRV